MADFSHLSAQGYGQMVDITGKEPTFREAMCSGEVTVSAACHESLSESAIREIITTARLAGIGAAKQTSTLIPYCHQIPLAKVAIEVTYQKGCFLMTCTTKTKSETGVEMEGMTALGIAGATIYDMVKAVDPRAVVGPFRLDKKRGGKLGDWKRGEKAHEPGDNLP